MIFRPLLALLLLILLVLTAKSQTREEFSYDDMGRVSRYRVVQGAQAYVVNYEYDKLSNLTRTFSQVVSSVDETDRILTINVRPNPTSTDVVIEAPSIPGSMVSFSITSNTGRQILNESVTVDDTGIARLTIDTAKRGLASGTYNIMMNNGATSASASFVVAK